MHLIRCKNIFSAHNIRHFGEREIGRRTMRRTRSVFFVAFGLTIENASGWTAKTGTASLTSNGHLSTQLTHTSLAITRWVAPADKGVNEEEEPKLGFKKGDPVQVEVVSFGRLGATVEVVGIGHSPDGLIGEDDPPLGVGLILQREIHYFREGRKGVDVVTGEVLPAYVEEQRDDEKLNVSLRPPGGKAKATEVSKQILDHLSWSRSIALGDKSSPEEISLLFPGVSKVAFKKAVAALYKKGLVKPGPYTISLMTIEERKERQ